MKPKAFKEEGRDVSNSLNIVNRMWVIVHAYVPKT